MGADRPNRGPADVLVFGACKDVLRQRDVDTAAIALESADSRLAALRDPGVTEVRQQLAKEIQALRSVRRADTTGILVRLTNAEEQAAALPVRGIVAVERTSPVERLPEGFFARAWTVAGNAISGLISIRNVDDRQMARAVGIPVSRLFTIVFCLGAGIAGAGGVLGGPILSAYPGLDADMLPLALIVVILGGIGSLFGAFIGSFIIGFIYTFGTALIPDLAYIILFLPMIVVIAFRPQGLFGRIGA